MAYTRGKYLRIISAIYLALPYTLLKQRLFFRLRKPPEGLPQFLCIGTQKSGTTWLNEQLKKHPSLCMPNPKEVRFFDWYFYRSFDWYLKHFNCAKGKIKGEVTPGYSIIEKGRVKFIRHVMPDVKIILLLRDPRKRAWSSARYHFAKEMSRDLKQISTEEFIAHFQKSWVRKMGDYKTIWNKWSSVFPREQLLVIFNEEIDAMPEIVIERIYNFIGVPLVKDNATLVSRPNKSEELEMPAEVKEYLDKEYLGLIREMPQWLGEENLYWKV
ncbi:MAG: sulfotransferase domain-containing protein [Bacteroidia bacterium]